MAGLPLARRLLRRARSGIVRRMAAVRRRLGRWCGGSRPLAGLYYALFSDAFRREQHAFLAGVARYEQSLGNPGETSALLRRNTHRLEKGLLMRPRRDVFATDYIGETVDAFEKLLARRGPAAIQPGSELQWARDVLSDFFDVAGSHPKIDSARERFQNAVTGEKACAQRLVPYQRDLAAEPPVGFDALLALARRRRSVRWFLDKTVPREMIDRAIEVAGQSPSACNRQPFLFRVLDDPELVDKASVIPMGTVGYAHNIPVFVVVVGQQRHYFHERDRHLIYIDGSLAAMGFVYALESQGLSTCCINWPDIEDREQQMATLLHLEPDERPIMCIAVGYPDPDGLVAYSAKKPVGQLRRYNFE